MRKTPSTQSPLSWSSARSKSAKDLIRSLAGQQKQLRRLLSISKELRGLAESVRLTSLVHLCNLLQYYAIWMHDFSCLLEDFVATRSRWRKKLYARHVALTIYEGAEDCTYLFGKQFKDLIERLRMPNEVETSRRQAHAEITGFLRRNRQFLKTLRNATIAHRDHDSEKQIGLIGSIDTVRVHKLSKELLDGSQKCMVLVRMTLEQLVIRIGRATSGARMS